MKQTKKGGFTLPGEAGCEALTLELADRWGADVIRDSDGTELSDEILDAGYSIYSTICLIRDHNEWAREHPDCLQQTFLTTRPCLAGEGPLSVALLADFFDEQFRVNDGETARRYWQVWDRTEGTLLDAGAWHWQPGTGCVVVDHPTPYHSYTVSFLAYRIWEEISMYNHLTNHWDKEHLMPIDPRRPEARAFLTDWLRNWCETHPHTTVVRFTSLFYNFVWIWGSDERNRSLFTDWGSYDFTVSEQALADFAAEYGYELTAEDFINKGNFQVTHQPPTAHKRDYMAFTQRPPTAARWWTWSISTAKRPMSFTTTAGSVSSLTAPISRPSGLTASSNACSRAMKCGCAPVCPPRSMNCACTPTSSRWGWAVRRPSPRAAIPPAMPARTGTMSAAPCCVPRLTASGWAATCTW